MLRGCVYFLALIALFALTPDVSAITRYVSTNSASPSAPYTSWTTAARSIQDAADACSDGDEVVVAKGIYNSGGRVVNGTLTNRVAIARRITIRSINGLANTCIVGNGPGSSNGTAAVRCLYIPNGAVIIGFTITNGYTTADRDWVSGAGGGIWSEDGGIVSNCLIASCSATLGGGGAYGAQLRNCTITNNHAENGGGLAGGSAENSLITCNSAENGGGAWSAGITNCTITANSAVLGGGAYSGAIANSAIHRNKAAGNGGGARLSTLYNCTITANQADQGGGIDSATAYNSIVYYNRAVAFYDWLDSTLQYCVANPLPPGTGNRSDSPGLLGQANPHLTSSSPCINAGNNALAAGTDIDSEPRIAGPAIDIGCDEYTPGTMTGALSVTIQPPAFNSSVPSQNWQFYASIEGKASAFYWDFGNGPTASNSLLADFTWPTLGPKTVTLTALNDSGSRSAQFSLQIVGAYTCYVSKVGTPLAPFTTWATAAATIQDAIDALPAFAGAVIIVSNGVYDTGGRVVHGNLANRVAAYKPVVIRSLNGPANTLIQGAPSPQTGALGPGAVRCIYLTNNASLHGFTLTNGFTLASGDWNLEQSGGGILCEGNAIISNCVVAGCAASDRAGGVFGGYLGRSIVRANSAANGGGLFGATLGNSLVADNSAVSGGGCLGCDLESCTVAGNRASYEGGGVMEASLYNCIVFSNTAASNPNYLTATFERSCTTPRPPGIANIDNDPLFLNTNAGTYRLAPLSPCINAGSNRLWMITSTDPDGNPRVRQNIVDIGAFEFQPFPPNPWLLANGFDLHISTDQSVAPSSHVYQVWNEGTGTVWYTLTSTVPWMRPTPATGSSIGERDSYTLTFDTTALPTGRYSGTLTIASPQAANTQLTFSVALDVHPPLGQGVDSPALHWITGGNRWWATQNSLSHDGTDALQTGPLGDSMQTWVEAMAFGPGTLSFWWRVSSEEPWDTLTFLIDGAEQARTYGITGSWAFVTANLSQGPHVFRWTYAKDSGYSDGADAAWLDQVSFVASNPTQDSDQDSLPDVDEVAYGTNPNDDLSNLRLAVPIEDSPSVPNPLATVRWYSITNRFYSVERTDNITNNSFVAVATNLPATPPFNTWIDTNLFSEATFYYRIHAHW